MNHDVNVLFTSLSYDVKGGVMIRTSKVQGVSSSGTGSYLYVNSQ